MLCWNILLDQDGNQKGEISLMVRSAALLGTWVVSFSALPFLYRLSDKWRSGHDESRNRSLTDFFLRNIETPTAEDRDSILTTFRAVERLKRKRYKNPQEVKRLMRYQSSLAVIENWCYEFIDSILTSNKLMAYRVFHESKVLVGLHDLKTCFKDRPEQTISLIGDMFCDPEALLYLPGRMVRQYQLSDRGGNSDAIRESLALFEMPVPGALNGEQLLHIRESLQPSMTKLAALLALFRSEIGKLVYTTGMAAKLLDICEEQFRIICGEIQSAIDREPLLMSSSAADPDLSRLRLKLGLTDRKQVLAAMRKIGEIEPTTFAYLQDRVAQDCDPALCYPYLFADWEGET